MRRRVISTLSLAALTTLAAAAPASAAERQDTLELGGRDCKLIEVPTAAPFGSGGCRGVRPGGLVETPIGFCTMNFLFRDRDGRRYIGTAGHCVLRRDGEAVYGRKGPVAKDSRGRAIGRFRYAVLRGEKDFALIRLNKAGRSGASARMCHFGGPTGTNSSRPRRPIALSHYGNGLVTGDITPARTFLALSGMPSRNHVFATGAVAPGDSGGPVTRSGGGGAVGLVVTVGVHGARGEAGTVGITRLQPQEQRAEAQIGEQLRILTARRR